MEIYMCLMPVVSGVTESKVRTAFTTDSGTARSWAEERAQSGATYHTLTLSEPLPTGS